MYFLELPTTALKIYFFILMFLAGACAGSFVNCAAERYAEGQSVFKGRSKCPACERELGVIDLIPIFSYIFLRGKCRKCGAKIPPRCLITELLGGAIWLVVAVLCGFSLQTLQYVLLFSALFAVALIDLDTMEIPNGLLIFGLGLYAVFIFDHADIWAYVRDGLIGAAALGGGLLIISLIMDKILKRDTLGGGDIKLFALVGLFTGAAKGLLTVIFACLIGLVFALVAKKNENKEFPFGPAIVIAAAIALLAGQYIIDFYLSLF